MHRRPEQYVFSILVILLTLSCSTNPNRSSSLNDLLPDGQKDTLPAGDENGADVSGDTLNPPPFDGSVQDFGGEATDVRESADQPDPDGEALDSDSTTDIDCGRCLCPGGFVRIEAGTFAMGSPESEPGREPNEPLHSVALTHSYCMKATEVTVGEWKSLLPSPSRPQPSEARAVVAVSWWDAVAYVNEMSAAAGIPQCYQLAGCLHDPGSRSFTCASVSADNPYQCAGFRLPTEAEWEYAARAGTTGATYNGTSTVLTCDSPNAVLDSIAWYCGNTFDKVSDTAVLNANAWGLFDMLGNAWEWTNDWYGPLSTDDQVDPVGPDSGSGHVVRGGSWGCGPSDIRAARRAVMGPTTSDSDLGFRPVISLPDCSHCQER